MSLDDYTCLNCRISVGQEQYESGKARCCKDPHFPLDKWHFHVCPTCKKRRGHNSYCRAPRILTRSECRVIDPASFDKYRSESESEANNSIQVMLCKFCGYQLEEGENYQHHLSRSCPNATKCPDCWKVMTNEDAVGHLEVCKKVNYPPSKKKPVLQGGLPETDRSKF